MIGVVSSKVKSTRAPDGSRGSGYDLGSPERDGRDILKLFDVSAGAMNRMAYRQALIQL